ncbi:MAG: bifunctional ADP-heptose synthase [Saprospiraceae bacterium]|nr:carbohydrate kinase [Lewinellaceae bacterium]
MTAGAILQKLGNHEVLIVGDVMLDRYLMGNVSRISPEAPVPVVLYQRTEDRLGGAANVALNVQALGAVPILCSVVGDDPDGHALQRILPATGMRPEGLVFSKSRKTTVKTRVLGNNQQMLRIDQEDVHDLSEQETTMLVQTVSDLLDRFSVKALIFQDYNKGVLTPAVIRAITDLAKQRGVIISVDPKKANFFAYQGVDLFKPNLKEIRESVPFDVETTLDSLKRAADYLKKRLQNGMTMITLSEKGLFLDDGKSSALYPTIQRNVADVSGAGDSVIGIVTLGLVAGLDSQLLAALSNLSGGQVCEYPGVVPVQRSILEAELSQWLSQ